ncbi:MAG: 4-hydroxy-tetrahydrodipicolinate synthase [Acidimicrobiales bacterium]|jgi:4-hydroxy-tetrahydrodipicolinate synthase
MARFGPVLSAMVTPFDRDGNLDLDAAQTLAKWLVENGNDGVVVAGTTGESATLTHDEQVALITAVRDAIPNHSLVAGAGSNDTRAAVELTQRATAAGANGILQVTPYYNRPSQAGLAVHFKACAEATDLPLVIYDIPARTGRKISHALFHELFEIENVVAIKDAAGNPALTAELLAEAPDRIEVYSGDDSMTLPLLAVGAVGVIGVATHWVGVETQEMIAAFQKGQVADATRINAGLIPSWNYEASDDAPNPVPTKALMNLLGVPVGDCRPPMGPAPADLSDRARALLADLGRDI